MRTPDEAFVLDQGFEQCQRVGGIVAKIFFRDFHGLAGFNGSGEVNDGVYLAVFENTINLCAV